MLHGAECSPKGGTVMWMAILGEIGSDTAAAHRALETEAFVSDAGSKTLVLGSGAAQDALAGKTVTPLSLLFDGGNSGRSAGPHLFCVGLWTPSAHREEFLTWYQQEHLPMLLECESWDGCRFVESPATDGCQFFALHQLADRAALDSEARRASRKTPWFKRLNRHNWFDRGFTRDLYTRVEEGGRW